MVQQTLSVRLNHHKRIGQLTHYHNYRVVLSATHISSGAHIPIFRFCDCCFRRVCGRVCRTCWKLAVLFLFYFFGLSKGRVI